MVGEEEYNRLLHYTKKFCKDYNHVDYRELAHNILFSGEWEKCKLHDLCRRYVRCDEEKHVIALGDYGWHLSKLKNIEHKYCYHCGQVLPLEYFMYGEKIRSSCREAMALDSKKGRDELSDRYIKDNIRKNKKKESVEATRERILKRRSLTREEQKEKKHGWEKKSKSKGREEINDSYVMDMFRKLKIPKEQVTAEMIEEKRQSIREKRIKKLQK